MVTSLNETLLTLSSWLLGGTFFAYTAASLLYMSGAAGRRMSHGSRFIKASGWGAAAHTVGVGLHLAAILTRWQGSGYWPTSNMYEFIGFLAFSSMLAFVVINRMYSMPMVGALVAPIGVFLIAYSYVFPPSPAPLVPALRSYWLPLHVSTVALGGGFFAVAFGTALFYLLRIRGLELAAVQQRAEVAAAAAGTFGPGTSPSNRYAGTKGERVWHVRLMEGLIYLMCVYLGFILLANGFRHLGFQWIFDYGVTYHLPPIIGPAGEAVGSKGTLLGFLRMPLVAGPNWMRGKHVNTLLYALAAGALIYHAIRGLLTKGQPIGDRLAELAGGFPEALDEISYRAVTIGYPLYTLGGLVFAMFWAKEAWSRYWSWDPKETWALITWLVYSAYLHLRISQGWEGRRAAWVAVLGFLVMLFTLVGVNLLIVGLHSYAGGD